MWSALSRKLPSAFCSRCPAPRSGAGAIQLGGQVAGLEVVVRQEVASAAVEGVGAALGDEVERDAAGRQLHVVAARRVLDLLEGVVVEVGGRGAGRGHVGHGHAVDRPLRVRVVRALGHEAGLLAAFVAGDVDAVEDHAGHGAQHGPWVTRLRHLVQLVGADVGGGAGLLGVDDRGLGRDCHRLLDGRDLERERQVDVDAGLHADLARHRAEAGEAHVELVGAGEEVQEAEVTLATGIGGPGAGVFPG